MDRAVTETDWKFLSDRERREALQWIADLEVPDGSPLGESYFYRPFEFVAPDPSEKVDFEAQKEAYFVPYLSVRDADGAAFPTSWETFCEERNEVLDQICARPCQWRDAWGRSGKKQDPLTCEESFAKGFYAAFSLKLSRSRGQRVRAGDPAEKSILIHDIRFLGHPVTVELRYLDVQNPQQRKRLHHLSCCYPGSGKNVRRFSARLGARINVALANHIRKNFISEGSAVSVDVINRWNERQNRLANQGLQKAVMQYNAAHCMNFSTVTVRREVECTGSGGGAGRLQAYRVVCRKEEGYPLRMLAVHQEKDWNLMGKLARGESFAVDDWWYGRAPIAPERMFNLAVDYLSAPENNFLCRPGSASPVLGAMLFLLSYSGERGMAALRTMDGGIAGFYLHCYEMLMSVCENAQMETRLAMASALPLLAGAKPQAETAFEQEILKWRHMCEMTAGEWGIHLPVCSAEPYHLSEDEAQFLCSMGRPVYLQFPLPSGVETFRELITRLLIWNPATLSVVRGDAVGAHKYERKRLVQAEDPAGFACALREDGMPDYEHVIPGIEIDELKNLLQQGFPMEERDGFLKRGAGGEFIPPTAENLDRL